jgi:hypothetical protein
MVSDHDVAEFYSRTTWATVGQVVADADDPSRHGTVVKRGGRQWSSRDKLPMVRWHGKIDAETVPWERLARVVPMHRNERPA